MSNSKQPIAFVGSYVPVLLDLLALLNQGLSLFGLHLSLHGPCCWWAGGPSQCSLVQPAAGWWWKTMKTHGKTAEDQEPPRTCPPVLKLHHFCLEPSTIHKVPQTWHVRSFSSPAAWLPVESRGHMGHGSPEPTVPPKKNRFLGRSCSFKLIKRWLRHQSRPMIYSFNPNHPPWSSNIKQVWAMMRWRKRKKKRRPMTARAFIVSGKWPTFKTTKQFTGNHGFYHQFFWGVPA